ncbi:MFS transporter, partial [Streptomyces sp. NPDC054804]
MTADLTGRRNAVFVLFFVPGLTISSWVTRTPDVRDLVGASTAQMGLILFGLSVGSMAGILCSGALVARWGARLVILAGTSARGAPGRRPRGRGPARAPAPRRGGGGGGRAGA